MLELDALAKRYGDFRLGPVDLAVGTEVLAVLGPSGCGKTTLLELVAGLAAPDGGGVALDGRSLVGRPPEDRRVGLVFQDGALFPHLTARENVAYAAEDPGAVLDLVERLEVADVLDRRPAALSGGERRRVALARALAADPDALLLDEPLASLDVPTRERLRAELEELLGSLGVPVVHVTHDRTTARALGDRVAVLREGRLVQVGPTETVFARPATPFVARFTGANVVPAGASTVRDAAGGGAVDGAGGDATDVTDAGAGATGGVDAGSGAVDATDAGGGATDDAGVRDPDGAVGAGGAVAIRPEHVRLTAGADASVVRVTREDAAARVTLDAGEYALDAYAVDPPAAGDRVGIELPPEHCWPLRRAGGPDPGDSGSA